MSDRHPNDRYEILYSDPNDGGNFGRRKSYGWASTMNQARRMCGEIYAHHSWRDPEVQDHETGQIMRGPT